MATTTDKIDSNALHTFEVVNETADFLKAKGITKPQIGIVLGTGLGSLAKQIQDPITVSFNDCPLAITHYLLL